MSLVEAVSDEQAEQSTVQAHERRARPPRRGLVLGAGGVLGGCWSLGVLKVLAEHTGWDPRDADVVVGTSVGSAIAALLSSGVSAAELVAHQYERPSQGRLAHACLDHEEMLPPRKPALGQLMGSPTLLKHSLAHPFRASPVAALAALCPCGTTPFDPVRTFLSAVLTEGAWPPGNHLVATNYDTGERTTFAEAHDVDVREAVAASCAVPGCFPPVSINRDRYIDGSVSSVTSADVLAQSALDEVYVVAPMGASSFDTPLSPVTWLERGLRAALNREVEREVDQLRRAGIQVTVLAPSARDLAAMGLNTMDPARRLEVLDTAQHTAADTLHAAGRATLCRSAALV